jgi:hypothetical protein
MKAVIVCGFDTYEPRIRLVKTLLESKGYEVVFILSNFKHSCKQYRLDIDPSNIYIPTKQYLKNISVARLISHLSFSLSILLEL